MRNGEKLSLEQIRAFLEGSAEVEFAANHRQEVYDWISRTLAAHDYGKQPRAGKQGAAPDVSDEDDRLEPGAGNPAGGSLDTRPETAGGRREGVKRTV